jgi:hypothetical protein
MNKLIIAGSRHFKDKQFIFSEIDKFINGEKFIIISGGTRGVDNIGEQYAKERGLSTVLVKPDWDKYGKAAGPIRNEQMAKFATHCILFWNGKSKGSKSMKNLAIKYNLVLREILIN